MPWIYIAEEAACISDLMNPSSEATMAFWFACWQCDYGIWPNHHSLLGLGMHPRAIPGLILLRFGQIQTSTRQEQGYGWLIRVHQSPGPQLHLHLPGLSLLIQVGPGDPGYQNWKLQHAKHVPSI